MLKQGCQIPNIVALLAGGFSEETTRLLRAGRGSRDFRDAATGGIGDET